MRAAVDHWKARRPRPLADPDAGREPVRGPGPLLHEAARTTGSTARSTSSSSRWPRRRSSDGKHVEIELPVRNVNRTVGTMLGSAVTRKWGGDGLPDDTIRHPPARLGRPELRRVRAARHHAAARGRRQRLLRQGPVGRHRDRATPTATRTFVAEDNIIAGNVALYGATSGEAYLPRRRRRALLRAQLRRDGGRRGRRRPRLRVHDRRARGGARPDRAATSRPACRAASRTSTTPTTRSPRS